MDISYDKILVIADKDSKAAISNAIDNISSIEVLEAYSENMAFEMIYTHDFVLAIIDETLEHIDIYKIGSMLLSHKATHNIPLLIITENIQPDNIQPNNIQPNSIQSDKFLNDFKALQVDYITKPFSEKMIQARIQIFFDIFKQKNAISQSVDELDLAYKKIIAQNEKIMYQELLKKELIHKSSIAATQMQQAIPNLKGSLHNLMLHIGTKPELKAILGNIQTSAEYIGQISGKLFGFKKSGFDDDPYEHRPEKKYKLIYVQSSDEEYNIFKHCLNRVLPCDLVWAKTIDQALEHIAETEFDLIFTDHFLPGATGFDLLSRLKQMRSDTPVIFAFSKALAQTGAQALSKGAFNFFIKEEISSTNLVSIINNTLQKARISQQVEDAMNRIVMIAQKDTLTRLYNIQYFEKELADEISKARRYKSDLSILIIHFDKLDHISSTSDPGTCDMLLATGAGLVQSMIRGSDTACRFSKERFALILPHTSQAGAGVLAKRITKKIKHYNFLREKKAFKLTVTIGLAQYKYQKETPDTTLVDNTLESVAYAARQGGDTIKICNP